MFLLPFNTRILNEKVSKRPEKVHSQPCYISYSFAMLGKKNCYNMEKPSENNSCYQQGQAPSSLAAPSLPICRKHQPSPPWALSGLPCALEKQKGTTGPQRLGSRQIKEPSIFGEKEKGRDCSQQGHHPQSCENSLC